MSTGLNPNDLISVSINLAPTAAPTQSFGGLLALGTSNVIDVVQRIRSYTTLTAVALDFGTGAPEYAAAALFFGQSPQPSTFYAGRWAYTATSAILQGGTLSATAQAISNFTSITNGSTEFTIDGSLVALSSMNFTSVTNLNGVASVITTALGSHGTCTWNSVYSRFQVQSATTGSSSSMTFASATGSGTDISSLIGCLSTQGGYVANGINAESFTTAVTTLMSASNLWYGLVTTQVPASSTDLLNAAIAIEAASPARYFVYTSQDPNTLLATSTTDFPALLQAGGYNHTATQYSSSSPYAGASYFARQASVNFTAQNSTITLMYKNEPGVSAETLTETQAAVLKAKNCNVFVNYSSATAAQIAIIQYGTSVSGQYTDTVVGTDWLANALQVALFNALYLSTTKIPQTDSGVNQLVNAANGVMAQSVTNALMAPGTWTGPNFGTTNSGAPLLTTGQSLPLGYLIYVAPVSTQTAAQRGARQAPPIQVAAKLGGAIHTASVVVSVVS